MIAWPSTMRRSSLRNAVIGGLTAAGEGVAIGTAGTLVGGAVIIGGLWYGAWEFGEWIAEQPWNPLTHPQDSPQPRAVPTCNNPPKVIPIPPPLMLRKACPPCPSPPPPQIHRVPPARPHFPCPGDHWHFFVYNQNPVTCQCYLQKNFGGCCGTPGAPC